MRKLLTIISGIAILFTYQSCNDQSEKEFEIKQLEKVQIDSQGYSFENYPGYIGAVNDTTIAIYPRPAREVPIFSTETGKFLYSINLNNRVIDSLKNELVLPTMKNFSLISRDSFVKATKYDPGSIEFTKISFSNDQTYVGFNLPVFYFDEKENGYKYNPAVFIGRLKDGKLEDIRFLPGVVSENSKFSNNVDLNAEWPFLTYGFSVSDNSAITFNLTKPQYHEQGKTPVFMKYERCRNGKCTPTKDHPEIYLTDSDIKSTTALGKAIISSHHDRVIAYWNDKLFDLKTSKTLVENIADLGLTEMSDFDIYNNNLVLVGKTKDNKGRTPDIYSILLEDLKDGSLVEAPLNDTTTGIYSNFIDVYNNKIFYLNPTNNELHQFKVE